MEQKKDNEHDLPITNAKFMKMWYNNSTTDEDLNIGATSPIDGTIFQKKEEDLTSFFDSDLEEAAMEAEIPVKENEVESYWNFKEEHEKWKTSSNFRGVQGDALQFIKYLNSNGLSYQTGKPIHPPIPKPTDRRQLWSEVSEHRKWANKNGYKINYDTLKLFRDHCKNIGIYSTTGKDLPNINNMPQAVNTDEINDNFFIPIPIPDANFNEGEIVIYTSKFGDRSKAAVKNINYSSGFATVTFPSGNTVVKISSLSKLNNMAFPKKGIYNIKEAISTTKNIKEINFFDREIAYKSTFLFYARGVFNSDVFIEYNKYYGQEDFSLNDYSEDLMLYLPVDFCAYAGYNEDSVRWYIGKLSELGIANISFLGIDELSVLNKYINENGYANLLSSTKVYKIYISGESSVHKNLLAKFTFFLTGGFSKNINIPGIIFNIEDTRQGLDSWQSIMLSMFIINSDDLFLINGVNTNRGLLDLGINIFDEGNSLPNVLRKLISTTDISTCFSYRAFNVKEFKKLKINNKKLLSSYIEKYKQLFN